VENVIIKDKPTAQEVSDKLGCSPLRIEANRLLPASRDRLCWCNFGVQPTTRETVRDRDGYRKILVERTNNPFIPDKGWCTHADWPGYFPTIVGWTIKSEEPRNDTIAGFRDASDIEKQRWRSSKWLINLSWYKNCNMLWPRGGGAGTEPRMISASEAEQCLGFPRDCTDLPEAAWQRLGAKTEFERQVKRKHAVGNAIAVPVLRRLIVAAVLSVSAGGSPSLWWDSSLPQPWRHDIASDVFEKAAGLAQKYDFLMDRFYDYSQFPRDILVGADPQGSGRANRAQRRGAMQDQAGIFLSKNGTPSIIPLDTDLDSHVRIAQTLQHPFRVPPDLPLDLQFASRQAIAPRDARRWRQSQWGHIQALAAECTPLDAELQERMPPTVKHVAGSLRLGFVCVLIHLLRWPDWQLPSLFIRGYHISGEVEASNIYPDIEASPELLFADISDPADADAWNESLARDLLPREYDEQIFRTACEQRDSGLLSGFLSKQQMDAKFGKGRWRALRRRGIWQGHVRVDGSKKIRGIDNARTSRHNAAAFLTETITTSPTDIALQICAWLAYCGFPARIPSLPQGGPR